MGNKINNKEKASSGEIPKSFKILITSIIIFLLIYIIGISLFLLTQYRKNQIESVDNGNQLVESDFYMKESDSTDKAGEGKNELINNGIYTLSNSNQVKTTEEIASLKSEIVVVKTSTGQGSGVVINDREKYIITNWHVVEESVDDIIIYFDSEDEIGYTASLIKYDVEKDIALLKTEEFPAWIDISYIPFGDSRNVKEGQQVITIGSPKSMVNTVAEGIISAIRKEEHMTYLQTTAPLSPGGSGGAMLNNKGELIGINTFKIVNSENLNFAVSSYDIMAFLDETMMPSYSEYKKQKNPIMESTIKDDKNNLYDFFIFTDDEEVVPYENTKEDSWLKGVERKVTIGTYRIAYRRQGVSEFKVEYLPLYQVHNTSKNIPLKLTFVEESNQIYVLKTSDPSAQDVLVISNYYEEGMWLVAFLTLQNDSFAAWEIDSGGWSDIMAAGHFLRRSSPMNIELLNIEGEKATRYNYSLDFTNQNATADEPIYEENGYREQENWIEIGK